MSKARYFLIILYAWFRRKLKTRRGVRLTNSIYPKELRQSNPIQVEIPYINKFKVIVNTSSLLEWNLFMYGYYEKHLHSIFEKYIRPDDTVLDVGANIGVHTLFLSDLVGKGGTVVAFEPYLPVLKKLKHHLSLNRINNVLVLPLAISNSPNKSKILNKEGSVNEGMASIFFKETELDGDKKAQDVDVDTIDRIVQEHKLSKISLIKMDIQGSEFNALQGAKTTLERWNPAIIFEYDQSWEDAGVTFDDAKAYLDVLGYSIKGINHEAIIEDVDFQKHTEFIAIHDSMKQIL